MATRKSDYVVKLNPELRATLDRKHIDFLLVLYSDYIYSYTQVGVKQVHSRSQMSVIDVKNNEEIYFGPMVFGGSPKVEKSIREIENNNLAGLKTIMYDGIDSVASLSIPKALGFSK